MRSTKGKEATTMRSTKGKDRVHGEDVNRFLRQGKADDHEIEEIDDDDEEAEVAATPSASTNKFEFQGKTYTRYQDFVDAKRAFNEDVLNSVGVVEAAEGLRNKKGRPVTPESLSSNSSRKRRSLNSVHNPRKSPRLEKQKSSPASEGSMGATNGAVSCTPNEMEESDSREEASVRPVRRRVVYGDSRPVERVYPNDVDESWVAEMQDWLEPLVSLPNCRNVMRQVRLLSSGVGVDYRYWPEGISFHKGIKVDLTFDLDGLLEEAYQFENTHGKDRGNGWLLLHPIKKMSLYKKYLGDRS